MFRIRCVAGRDLGEVGKRFGRVVCLGFVSC